MRLCALLGRDPDIRLETLLREATARGVPLVLFVLGTSPSVQQQALVEKAMMTAATEQLHLDLLLVPDAGALPDEFEKGDEVTFALDRREEVSVERALGTGDGGGRGALRRLLLGSRSDEAAPLSPR